MLAGLLAAHAMETHGHIVTGMNNQIVWGMPHVFAIFLIVAASGVLNVASIGSVFGQAAYKPRAPLSGLLCLALLAGGLFVLMLDLGRPERIVVAATHYNFTSVFAWNVFLYSGMFAIVVVYLWTLMERRLGTLVARRPALAAFAWRIILTSGTGSIFAFLVARQAYGIGAAGRRCSSRCRSPGGSRCSSSCSRRCTAGTASRCPPSCRGACATCSRSSSSAVLFFVAVYHLTNLYFAKQAAFERFILVDGGVYPLLFWWGYVVAGSLRAAGPALAPGPPARRPRWRRRCSSIVGAFALLYVFIIGGQAFPLEIFPGYTIEQHASRDGRVAAYAPSVPEVLLGVGGLAVAFLITVVGVRVLDFLPQDDLPPAAGRRSA